MAEETGIAWTDSTFNPWWGCSKVGPGCDNCYAETLDSNTGGDHWGVDKTPRTMSKDNWRKPRKWNRNALQFEIDNSRRRRVFSGSMCDVFDKNAPSSERLRLWNMIKETQNLDWLLLTKRAPNLSTYLPDDWGDGYDNVWLGVTVENQKHGKPRIDILRNTPAKIRFLSIEPLLEDLGKLDLSGIHWVIVGGESGPGARPMKSEWVENVKCQCNEQNVPFFFKQWGGEKNKDDCILNGEEFKVWPESV